MSREFLMLVQESAYKTPVATPVVWPTASANAFYIRLDGANVFTMRPRPVMVAVPYGGGVAIDAFRVSRQDRVQGPAGRPSSTPGRSRSSCCSGAASRSTAGQTGPWTTTEPAGDLASVAIYHAITRSRRHDQAARLPRLQGRWLGPRRQRGLDDRDALARHLREHPAGQPVRQLHRPDRRHVPAARPTPSRRRPIPTSSSTPREG